MENGRKDVDELAKNPAQMPFTLEAKKAYANAGAKADY